MPTCHGLEADFVAPLGCLVFSGFFRQRKEETNPGGHQGTGSLDQSLIQGRTRRLSAFLFGDAVVSRMISSGSTANSTG